MCMCVRACICVCMYCMRGYYFKKLIGGRGGWPGSRLLSVFVVVVAFFLSLLYIIMII